MKIEEMKDCPQPGCELRAQRLKRHRRAAAIAATQGGQQGQPGRMIAASYRTLCVSTLCIELIRQFTTKEAHLPHHRAGTGELLAVGLSNAAIKGAGDRLPTTKA